MTMPVVPAPSAPTAPSGAAPAAQAPPASAAPPVGAPRKSAADRASALRAKLEGEGLGASAEGADAGASEAGEGSAPPAGTVASPEGTAPADDAASKARAERLERIKAVREREAAARAQDEARKRAHERDAELAALKERLAKAETARPGDDVFSSEEALLAEAERRGMSSEKIVKWMRDRLTDPAAVASQKVKSEVDKIREELAAERKAREEAEKRIAAEREAAKAQHEAQQRAHQFISQAGDASKFPLTAKMLGKYGPNGLVAFVNHFVAPTLRADYTLDELHDHTEQFLDEFQLKDLAGASQPRGTPANGASPKAKNGAAEPTTLSNSLASERAVVTEEVPLHKLPRSERVKRLREKLERE